MAIQCYLPLWVQRSIPLSIATHRGFIGQRMMSSNKNDRHVEASRHYPVMKKDELCKLPIKQLADKDCTMFMWVTDSNLDEAMEVKSMGI